MLHGLSQENVTDFFFPALWFQKDQGYFSVKCFRLPFISDLSDNMQGVQKDILCALSSTISLGSHVEVVSPCFSQKTH